MKSKVTINVSFMVENFNVSANFLHFLKPFKKKILQENCTILFLFIQSKWFKAPTTLFAFVGIYVLLMWALHSLSLPHLTQFSSCCTHELQ